MAAVSSTFGALSLQTNLQDYTASQSSMRPPAREQQSERQSSSQNTSAMQAAMHSSAREQQNENLSTGRDRTGIQPAMRPPRMEAAAMNVRPPGERMGILPLAQARGQEPQNAEMHARPPAQVQPPPDDQLGAPQSEAESSKSSHDTIQDSYADRGPAFERIRCHHCKSEIHCDHLLKHSTGECKCWKYARANTNGEMGLSKKHKWAHHCDYRCAKDCKECKRCDAILDAMGNDTRAILDRTNLPSGPLALSYAGMADRYELRQLERGESSQGEESSGRAVDKSLPPELNNEYWLRILEGDDRPAMHEWYQEVQQLQRRYPDMRLHTARRDDKCAILQCTGDICCSIEKTSGGGGETRISKCVIYIFVVTG